MYIIFYLIVFLIIFLIDFVFILNPKLKNRKKNKKKKKKEKPIMELEYLSYKFNLDKEDLMIRWIFLIISFINAFIITTVSAVVTFVEIDMFFQLLIAFLLLLGLTYSIYDIFGRFLEKKVGK